MAIDTYNELKEAVASYLHRSDLTSEIVTFIALGEARLNEELRLLQQEDTATLTLDAAASSVPLPADYIEVIDVRYASDDWQPTFVDKRDLNRYRSSAAGRPSYYAIDGALQFDRPSDQSHFITLDYFKRWDIETDSTNWLLTNSPGAYLYAALLEAGAFIRKPDLDTWTSAYDRAVTKLNRMDGRTRRNRKMRVDDGALSRRGRLSFDIARGY